MAKRAISPEDKNKKKQLILEGAMELLEEGRFPLPSVNDIIKHIGEAKGTVYLYFNSKEEIYLSAMISSFGLALEKLIQRLKNDKMTTAAAIAKTITEFGTQNPKAAYLATITPVVLEQNVSEEFLLNYKRQLLDMTTVLGKIIHEKEGLSVHQARLQFIISFNLFIGMWQHLYPPKKMQALIEKNNLTSLQFDFSPTFRKMLGRIWQTEES